MRWDAYQRAALGTTLATYALIGIGGLVRASGAGLGCPDWPKCFGRWVPPLHPGDVPSHIDPALFNFAKTWTEYLNRLAGVVVGLLISLSLLLAWKYYRHQKRVFYPTLLAFILVLFEGWLGGQVVISKLKPAVLTVHLSFALVIVSLLLYATMYAFHPPGGTDSRRPRHSWFGGAIVLVLAVVLVQIGIGAAVRGEIQILKGAQGQGFSGGDWISNLGQTFGFHQSFAAMVVLSVFALAWFILKSGTAHRWLRRVAVLSASLVALQSVVGFGLVRLGLLPLLQVAHLWLGSILLGALTILGLLAYRQPGITPFDSSKLNSGSAS